MLAVPGALTDIVDVLGNVRKRDAFIFFCAACPAGPDHPIIESHADHAVSCNDGANLLVIKLSLMGDKGATIVVTCQNRTFIRIQSLPEGFIRKMRQVKE